MACLDMYNSDHKNNHQFRAQSSSPRISFSSDFVDIQQTLKQERSLRDRESLPLSSSSSDFEFSVSSYSMMSADELFFEGRLLPFKDNHNNQIQRTTLRDELLLEEDENVDDEDEDDDDDDEERVSVSHRPPPSSKGRWKGFLGLKKSHNATKKIDGSSSRETVADGKRPFGWTQDRTHMSKSLPGFQNEGD